MSTFQEHCQALVLSSDNEFQLVESAIRFVRSSCLITQFDNEQALFERIKETKTSGLPSCLIASATYLNRSPNGLLARLRDLTYLPVILLGDVDSDNLIESVDSIMVTGHPLTEDKISVAVLKALGWSEKYCQLFQQSERFKLLNERELNIVTLATEGVPNKSIAKRLGISIKTIERNRRCAYEKLGVTSTAGMAMLFTFRKFCVSDPIKPSITATPQAFSARQESSASSMIY
jgi:DNA-binding NarL/FixJ family response regulator